MSAHRLPSDLSQMALIGGTLAPTTTSQNLSNSFWRIDRLNLTAASEVLAAPDPVNAGIVKVITVGAVSGSGSVTVTFSTPFDAFGDTKLVFNAVRQTAMLISVPESTTGAFRWELIALDGATGGFIGQATVRQVAQYDIASSTVLANPGMQVTLIAGKSYKFRAVLVMAAGATGGIEYSVGGTATATTVGWTTTLFNQVSTPAFVASAQETGLGAGSQVTAAADTGYTAYIDGVITVAAGGTFGPQFAQKVSNGTNSSMLIGSYLEIQSVN